MSDDRKLIEQIRTYCDSKHPTLGSVVLSVPDARRLLALARKGLEAEKAIADVLHVGGMMSNLCFNLSQYAGDSLSEHDAATMKQLQRQWDDAAAVVHGWRKRTAPKEPPRA